MSMTELLFSFKGRLNRKPFWLTYLVIIVLIVAIVIVALTMLFEHEFEIGGAMFLLLVVLYIPLIWVGLALGAKRLHDRDKSAWWLIVFYVIPGILSSLGNRMDDAGIILHLISFAISVWALVELGFLRGTVGQNRYGPDPLSPTA
jgi:uncharacterized membrane protein YhaH (DUF805 family)